MSKVKPNWWPKNPYPEDIFVMKRERYAEIVPDHDLRTGLSGMLGREFWEIASESIWDALNNAEEEQENDLLEACERDALLADIAISATPTGDLRNKLTEINILRLAAISKAKEGK